MTCNIRSFVFVKRWSIFCNYCIVFELQQYPWVLIIVVPPLKSRNHWYFYSDYTEVGEIEPILIYSVKNLFGGEILSSEELDTI